MRNIEALQIKNIRIKWVDINRGANAKSLSKEGRKKTGHTRIKRTPISLKVSVLEKRFYIKPIIIRNSLTILEDGKLMRVLTENTSSLGWKISYLNGISLTYCMHKIKIEE